MLKTTPVEGAALRLQEQMVALVRAFGLHRPDETPCGTPVSVAEAHAIMELSRNEGLSQQALCERLQLVKSTVSRVVTLLERRAWVERREDPHDGRAVRVYLTDQGKATAQQLAEARQAKFERLLERIPVTERDAIFQALATLAEASHEHH